MSCESCQSQFFSYLYELLEPAERHEMEVHLRGCPHCQLELDRTRSHSADIAAAVKNSFPEIVFKAPRPAAKTARPVRQARQPRRPLLLQRWALAAGLMIAVITAMIAVAWSISFYQGADVEQAEERLTTANAELRRIRNDVDVKRADVQKDMQAIKDQVDRLMIDYQKVDTKVRADDQKRVRFEIKTPRSIQAGATNRIEVQVKPGNPDMPPQVVKDVVARVVNDTTKQVLFTTHVLRDHQFTLPRDLPVRPGDSLSLEVEADVDGAPAQVREHLTLLTPEYVTHLSTDRPMYRPGEVVRFRSLTLDRFSLQPASEDLNLRFRIIGPHNNELYKHDVSTRLIDKDKQPVLGPDGQPLHGLGTGEFVLPKDLPGGVYSLIVVEQNERFPAERRTFVVHRWQQPRFNKEAEFTRASYGPGDQVTLRGKVSRVAGRPGPGGGAGGPLIVPAPGVGAPGMVGMGGENIHLQATAAIGGQQIRNEERGVEQDGSFTFEFNLPPKLATDSGSVTLLFSDANGGDVETLVKPIPIVLRDVNVAFYPEGGDLVVGVPNRVYFQATTGTYRPAEIRGRILERTVTRDKIGREIVGKETREVMRVETLNDDKEPGINQGLGAFTFTPHTDRRYELALDVPVGIARVYKLEAAKNTGVALHLPEGVVANDIPVAVTSVGRDRELLIGTYCRGRLLDHTPVMAPAGKKQDVVLHPAVNAGGVYRITVFEKQQPGVEPRFKEVAERLIFRKQTAEVHVAMRPNFQAYTPGDSVYLDLEARNEKNQVVPVVTMLAVIDSSVLKLANDRAARSMPTHFLLTTEIRRPEDLENADALLGTHPRAAQALDLLLGSQGWRRFAEQKPAEFKQKNPDAERARYFLASTQQVVKVGENEQETRKKIDKQFIGEFISLQEKLAEKERDELNPREQHDLAVAQMNVNVASQVLGEQRQRSAELWAYFVQAAFGVGMALFLFLAFFLVATSLFRLAEGRSGFLLLGGGLVLLVGLFVVSVLGTFALMGVPNEFPFGRNNRFTAAPTMKMAQPMVEGGAAVPVIPEAPRWAVDAQMPPDEIKRDEPGGPAAPPAPPVLDPQAFNVPGDPMPPAFDNERELRKKGRYTQILFMKLGREVSVPPPLDPSVMREYAHQHKSTQVRKDFAETLYWQPALVLKDGQGRVQFDLSDAVTNYRVLCVSHTLDGRLGADTIEIAARLPYQVEPKVPVEISSSDQVTIPVLLTNNSMDKTGAGLTLLAHKNLSQLGSSAGSGKQLEPGETRRQLLRFQPNVTSGTAVLRVQGSFAKGRDVVERSFDIVPDGFPAGGAYSGTLQGPVAAVHDIVMPPNWVPGSLTVQVQAYPSILTDLQRGLDALLREPHGCFEQSSSSNYPNVLILNYLQDTKQASPAVEKQARALMDRGYHQLLSFECIPPDDPNRKRGYEWFGQTAPPHEALTAYGLLQFHDMSRVYPVDKAMIDRTRQYLLDQRDGKGGFKRNARAIDRFGQAPQDVTNAYIVWALTESGVKQDLDRELNTLYEQAKTSQDPYFVALAGLGQLNATRTNESAALLNRLREFQQASGEVTGARTSITHSAGRDLAIETTALSALAWLRAGRPAEFMNPSQKAGRWLLAQRNGAGSFGSTQSTILALKALIEFTRANPNNVQRGELRVEFGRADVAPAEAPIVPGAIEPVTIRINEKAPDEFNPPAGILAPGKNEVVVRLTAGNTQIPYTLSWSYRTAKQASDTKSPLRLAARLSQPQVKEGQSVKLKTTLENVSGADQGMAVAVIGLPAGVTLPEDFAQLKELSRMRDNGNQPGVIDAWELKGRELVLYWRELKADAKVDLDLDVICRLPGVYSGPASRAYLYYNAERKYWIDPLRITIGTAQ
jgi:hypothetical protein